MRFLFSMMLVAMVLAAGPTVLAQDDIDRTVLPLREPERPTYSELDVRNVETPPLFEMT